MLSLNIFNMGFFDFFMYFIRHCFIGRPSDSTVPENAGMEPRTVATCMYNLYTRGGMTPRMRGGGDL
jgi:hypothetical protein